MGPGRHGFGVGGARLRIAERTGAIYPLRDCPKMEVATRSPESYWTRFPTNARQQATRHRFKLATS